GGLIVASSREEDALDVHDMLPPGLVILDGSRDKTVRMASLKRLKSHPALQGVPILIVSEDGEIDSFATAINKGAAAYLVKPVSSDELVAVARKLSGWAGDSDHTEKRRRLRRPLMMNVEIDIRTRRLRGNGRMLDASGGGCRIELDQELIVGEVVRVILCAGETLTYLALGGEVRWCRRLAEQVWLVGVRFTGTTAMLAGKVLGFTPTDAT
ncbi:MAG: PilZ domain-containing protein, partial [Vicinamibacteria bacterium]|nr:PilZ domain-containing protein [Vicinamibacteria bacterium]